MGDRVLTTTHTTSNRSQEPVQKEKDMTVNELIQQLSHYPGDMRVLTLGYEGGYNDMDLKTEDIAFDVNSKDTWYIGPHERVDMVSYRFGDDIIQGTKCLIVVRGK
jgi:hypothetical protein